MALAGPAAGELTPAPRALEDLDARAPAGLPRPELHRRPDPPAAARAVREPARLRRRAAHARAGARGGPLRRAADRERAADRRRAAAAAREADPSRLSDAPRAGARPRDRRALRARRPGARPSERSSCSRATVAATWSCWPGRARRPGGGARRSCSTGSRSRLTTATRSPPRRCAPTRWPRRSSAATSPSQIADALGGRRPRSSSRSPARSARSRRPGRGSSGSGTSQLEIDGGDLVAAGVPEGPAVGAGLRAALAAKLDGALSGREDELDRALRAARGSG